MNGRPIVFVLGRRLILKGGAQIKHRCNLDHSSTVT
jgi:hypothetical protein